MRQVGNQELAYLNILSAAFWNFVGAGVFGGGTLNAPLVNYYEHGTFLNTQPCAPLDVRLLNANQLIAIDLLYMVLRYFNGERAWNDRCEVWAFWFYNIGLVIWIVLNF
jgi:nitric oxide reductase subunit B